LSQATTDSFLDMIIKNFTHRYSHKYRFQLFSEKSINPEQVIRVALLIPIGIGLLSYQNARYMHLN